MKSTMKEVKRAALYFRVSTEDQARKGLSLPEQKRVLIDYANAHGMKIVGLYEDAGISARKPYKKRPALLRLLADCENHKVDTILFVKLDRWFRNVGCYYEVQTILDRCNVTWQATQEDYETVTASGRLKVNIMLSVAQDEADRTSERIKFINQGKRERLEALTGDKPFGYTIVDKKFIKDPEQEPIVNDFFAVYMRTGSIAKTRHYIEETYSLYMNYPLIDKMLRAETYIGTYYDTPGMCPAYITKEQHEKILTMRKRVVRKAKNNRVYLFSGLCICGTCGGRMAGKCQTNHNEFICYACSRRSARKSDCPNQVTLSQRKIEAYLLDALESKLSAYKMEASKSHPTRDNTKKIKVLENKLKRLKDLYINDIITLDELKADKVKYEHQIEALQTKEKAPDFSALDALLSSGWRDLYESSDASARAQFWRALIKEIRLYSDRHIEFDLNV